MLEKINQPNDIKKIKPEQYGQLASEIRKFLLEHVSRTGGHLASNLGAVELTMALHLVLDFPKDKLIWDVGHQAYTHKILTGRRDDFDTLRQYGGLSGFPKRRESPCDAFDTGHSSTSVSAALGIAAARDLRGTDETVVAVIGDGSLSGGMAYEALNNMSAMEKNFIVVLNDNEMSITRNVGGMSAYLGRIRLGEHYHDLKDRVEETLLRIPKIGNALASGLRRSKESLKQLMIPGMFFEDMGITYIGPIDGHNIDDMVKTLREAKRLKEPVLIHVITKKGKGYMPAESQPDLFHGVGPFDLRTGQMRAEESADTFTDWFGRTVVALGESNPDLVAITAAMKTGTGLREFGERFPERLFDVGIAEQHAVTFAAGLAAAGMRPVVAVYSSFLQRAYDQILHDVCLQKLPVVFAIDRSGIVGADGETHQGVFDLSYLSSLPDMTILSPANGGELEAMLAFALTLDGPAAIRYPRGTAPMEPDGQTEPLQYGKSQVVSRGGRIALLAVGTMMEEALAVRDGLREQGMEATVVNARFVKPLDTAMLDEICAGHEMIVTLEENVRIGGYGQMAADHLAERGYRGIFLPVALPDEFLPHGSVEQLRKRAGIDADSILKKILSRMDGSAREGNGDRK